MKIGLWIGQLGLHTIRFDDADLDDVQAVMKAVCFDQEILVSDFQRNIIGKWSARELRDAAKLAGALGREGQRQH